MKKMGNPLLRSAYSVAKAVLPPAVRVPLRERWEQHLAWILYVGRGTECPICGGKYREFMPHGVPVRKNSRCQGCGALERHRLMYLYLKAKTNLFSRKLRVLHFAPESMIRNIIEPASGVYVPVDLCSPGVKLHLDITRLPFADGTFDAVLCYHVLEHIPDDAAAMRELRRVLSPEGWAILQVPLDLKRAETYENWSITSPEDRTLHFGQFDHVRMYGRDYEQRLRKAGFQVRVDPFVREMGSEKARMHGLVEDEDIYFCTR